MPHERVLLILIVAELSLVVLAVSVGAALEPFRPSRVVTGSLLQTSLWLAAAVGTVVAWVGLLYLLREARVLYAASWAAYLTLTGLRGTEGQTAVDAVLLMATAVVGGMILGLVYFSELRTEFRSLRELRHSG